MTAHTDAEASLKTAQANHATRLANADETCRVAVDSAKRTYWSSNQLPSSNAAAYIAAVKAAEATRDTTKFSSEQTRQQDRAAVIATLRAAGEHINI